MYDVATSETDNKGGHKTICSIISTKEMDETSFPELVADPATNADYATMQAGDILAISGKKWTRIQTIIEKIGSAFSTEGSTGSMSFIANPKIRFENLEAEEFGFIKSILNKPICLVLESIGGTQWIYGSPKLPCYVSEAAGDLGTAVADDKFIEVTLRCIEDPAVYPGNISYVAVA